MGKELVGVEKVVRHLNGIKVSGLDLEQILMQACLIVENDARRNCPVDTGVLRNSITSEVEVVGTTGQGVVGTNESYAPYVEYGTGLWAKNGDGRQTPWSYQDDKGNWHTTIGQHPQPFLGPAFSQNKPTILKFIEERLKDVEY